MPYSINRLPYLLATIFIITLPVYSMDVGTDLALLEQQLLTLSQQIPAESLQKLINFNHTDIAPLLLTQALNDEAPITAPMVLATSPRVELVQLIVAWQDLPLKAFFGFSEGLNLAEYSLLLHGYKDAPTLVRLFKDFNGKLYKKLEPLANFYRDNKSDPLLGGGDASCGYHALKNALLVANAIYSGSTEEAIRIIRGLANLNLVNTLFGKPEQNEFINGYERAGAWRQFMINHPTTLIAGIQQPNYDEKTNPTAEWLHEAGINFLWNSSQKETYRKEIENIFTDLGQQKVYQALYKYQITLIHDLKFFAQNFTVTQNVIEKFKKERFAIFIINAGGNHWITLIVSAVGTTTQCIILDSKNWPRYDLPEINTIIKALTGASVPALSAPEIERRKAEKIKREKYLHDKAQKASATPTTAQLTRADMKALGMSDEEIDKALLAAKETATKKR
jgi:hypothetical protein